MEHRMAKISTNVCLVSPLPPPYGGIAHWTSMIVEYASKNEDVTFVVVNTAPRWRAIHRIGLLVRSIGGGIQLLRDVSRLIWSLSVRRFDAVHLTTSGQLAAVRDFAVALISTGFGIGLIYHIRFGRIPAIAEANTLEWKLIRRIMFRASRVIVIDRATFSAVKRFAPEVNVMLVPNCVNFSGLPAVGDRSTEVKTALFLGWVTPAKGIGELVEAWAQIRPAGWRLEIVGPGSADYQAALIEKFRPENVEFLGELAHGEAMKRMADCDLFILPSYTEGFPNVVVEAMALGRAIVATDVGAIPEMLEGDAGILVRSRDAKALMDVIETVTNDSELRERLGRNALAKAVNNYSIDVIFKKYMKIWRSECDGLAG